VGDREIRKSFLGLRRAETTGRGTSPTVAAVLEPEDLGLLALPIS
jgi:hypothetical protein